MTLRRRGFLRMLGAALAAPALPMAAPAAGTSPVVFARAVAHAEKFPVISVSGIAKRIGVSQGQAETLIGELAERGMVRLVNPSARGTVRAASNILTSDPWGVVRTADPSHAATENLQKRTHSEARQTRADISPLLAHLHKLCRANGFALHPRCFDVGALA